MTKIAILELLVELLNQLNQCYLKKTDVDMVLYLRHPNKLHQIENLEEDLKANVGLDKQAWY